MDHAADEALQLSEPYEKEYKKLYRMLRRDIRPGKERDSVLQDLHTLLRAAQGEQKLPESIYGGNFDDFYDELIKAMPSAYTQKERGIRHLLRCSAFLAMALVAISLALGLYYWNSGAFGVWSQGMSYLLASEHYTMTETAVEGGTFSIDLNDLDAAAGKNIFKEGRCQIDLTDVQRQDDGNYVIFFRAKGGYDRQGGQLVSAISNVSIAGHQGIRPTGSLLTEIHGQTYEGTLFSISELKKDGNMFGFYLFDPRQIEESILGIEQNGGEAIIKLQGLIRTVWSS